MRNVLIALVATFILASCTTTDNYLLSGKLDGSDGDKVFLQKRDGSKLVKLDSALTENGVFEFAPGQVEYPEMYYLSVDGKRGRLGFFLENSDITLTGNADTLYDVKVEGSATQSEYEAYNELLTPFYEKNSELYQSYREAAQAGDEEKAAALSEERSALFEEIEAFNKDFVKSNPASYVTPTVLQQISYDMEVSEMEEAIAALDASLAETQIIKDLQIRIEALKKVEIGKIAPDFTQNDVDGNPVTLSEMKGHKILLIDFWAAWCGPCRGENPNVVAVYNDFHDKGFDVLGVSLDNNKEDWVQAIADDKLAWTHVSDLQYWSNAAAKLYAVNSIPANFLIDAEGKILAKGLRGDDLREKVAELLSE